MSLRTVAAAAAALVLVAGPAHALERVSVPMDRDHEEAWDAGASCSVAYANTCTGWLWVWSGWDAYETFGVVFDPCCANGQLVSTQAYFWSGVPSGWGFTGVLSVHDVEFGCPGVELDAIPLLPPNRFPVVAAWSGIPAGPVLLTFTTGPAAGEGYPWGTSLPTDHPAAGPTGPQSCGLCFPSTRATHTFSFGTVVAPLCPGSPLNDGVCDAEALLWSAKFSCAVALEPTTWGSLKSLYR